MENTDLHFMVGEIRSDVKKLLVQDSTFDKRVQSLERSRWYAGGFIGAVLAVAAARFGIHLPT